MRGEGCCSFRVRNLSYFTISACHFIQSIYNFLGKAVFILAVLSIPNCDYPPSLIIHPTLSCLTQSSPFMLSSWSASVTQ